MYLDEAEYVLQAAVGNRLARGHGFVAGAHGMDLVLFTVAADDGVMPQTREHLDILHLLGVEHAVFVVTKIDRVPQARTEDVVREVQHYALTRVPPREAVPALAYAGVEASPEERKSWGIIEID